MSLALPNPRPNGRFSLIGVVLALVALAMLAFLSFSGPRTMEPFAQGTLYCRPLVGQTSYC